MTMTTDGLKTIEAMKPYIPYVLFFCGALVVGAVILQWLVIKQNAE